jgi:hypothetical protein
MDNLPDSLEPSPVAESASSKRDFWIGFIGWWVFNLCTGGIQFGLVYGFSTFSSGTTGYDSIISTLISGFGCLIFLANIGALIFFAFRRKQIAFGMLVAFGVSIAISLLIGVIAMVACFVILGQYNNP